MMNKEEWIAYFETINGRKPTPAELAQALQNGTIQTGGVAPQPLPTYTQKGASKFWPLLALACLSFIGCYCGGVFLL